MEERIGRVLEDTEVGKDFTKKTQTTWGILQRINNWDCILLKSFFFVQQKKPPTD